MRVERKAVSARPAGVRYVTVGAESAGQRLDNFLIRLSKGVPKSHIYQVVRSGQVRINSGRAAADRRLSAGDQIRIPPMRISGRTGALPPAVASMLPVVFEDEHLLVVDKPAGMAAHGGSGISFGVIERIRAARPDQPFLELAHRLDRDTSGLLLLGKSRRALLQMHAMLRQGQVEKHYLALVAGHWLNDRQHVKLALSRGAAGAAGKVRVDPEGGAASHSVFELRERFKQFALLDAELRNRANAPDPGAPGAHRLSDRGRRQIRRLRVEPQADPRRIRRPAGAHVSACLPSAPAASGQR